MSSNSVFVPDKATWSILKQLFEDVHVGSNEVQRRVSQELGRASEHPEFANYCICILGDQSESLSVRYTAGICLKSVLTRGENEPAGLEQGLFACFEENQELVRKAAKLALVAVVARLGILQCEKILLFFVQCIK